MPGGGDIVNEQDLFAIHDIGLYESKGPFYVLSALFLFEACLRLGVFYPPEGEKVQFALNFHGNMSGQKQALIEAPLSQFFRVEGNRHENGLVIGLEDLSGKPGEQGPEVFGIGAFWAVFKTMYDVHERALIEVRGVDDLEMGWFPDAFFTGMVFTFCCHKRGAADGAMGRGDGCEIPQAFRAEGPFNSGIPVVKESAAHEASWRV